MEMTLQQATVLAAPYAARHGLSLAFLLAVMKAESNFNPSAISPAGAVGLMQLMPATAQELGVSDRSDAEQSVAGGAAYLKRIATVDIPGATMMETAAAYNWGPHRVKAKRNFSSWPQETKDYVQRVAYYFVKYAAIKP